MTTSVQRARERLAALPPARARWALLLLGSIASALLLAAYARVESPWFVLGFVALVPWLLALDRATSFREAAGAGVALGAAFTLLVFPWLPEAAQRYAQVSSPVVWLLFVLISPFLEPQFISFALVRHFTRRAPGQPADLLSVLAAACAYVATELFVPKLFFDTLGHGLYPSVYLRQAADIAGVHGLTLVLLLVNEGAASAIHRVHRVQSAQSFRSSLAPLAPLGGAAALVLAVFLYGRVRYHDMSPRGGDSAYVVGLVQANITNYDKLRAEKGAFETVRSILDAHYALSDEIRAGARPDLIIWPETVYPTTFGSPKSEAGAAFDEEIAAFARDRGVPLIFGAYDAEDGREYNAAFFLSALQDGQLFASRYRKKMLFPLTEWVPSWLDSEWLRSALPWAGHWQRGPGPKVVELPLRDGRRAAVLPLICYDALFPDFVAEGARAGADLIVTLSNDSWFPDERAPKLHSISAAFRSVETRLPQVRATNSGVSAVISPVGEIIASAKWDARAALAADVKLVIRNAPLAMTWGRFLGPALLVSALALSIGAAARRRRATGAAAPPGGAAPLPAPAPAITEGDEQPRTQAQGRNKPPGKRSRRRGG